jgi:hypothetical protein
MTTDDRTFAVASDEKLIDLISRARTRLVMIAPALTKPVAEALARRFDDLGKLNMTVVLDSDPEVYRLGFGDPEALDTIRAASTLSQFDLREQAGVRIGVVISDDTTMVYSPVSRNIEAGSTSVEKPNAIMLSGNATNQIAAAASSGTGEEMRIPEVGSKALEATKVDAMKSDLKANPPMPVDITRKMNVFTSKVQYVELSISNCRFATRQIPLPPQLSTVADDDLRDRISSRIRSPLSGIDKLDVTIEDDGKSESLKVDDDWLNKERIRIEKKYTFQINNFGRVILYRGRDAFNKAISRFKLIVHKYQTALGQALVSKQTEFQKRIVDEFSPRWKQNPPEYFERWEIEPADENIRAELQRLAQQLFESAVTFEPPDVKLLYKNVAPENIRDERFLEPLKKIMIKRGVPSAIINTLFESGQAAPETGAFLGR